MMDERHTLRQLTDDALVWDNHACMPLSPDDVRLLPQLHRCREAGVDLVTLPIGYGSDTVEQHIRVLANYRDWLARHPEHLQIVGSITQARAAKEAGKLGVCFDIEGMNAVALQPSLVRLYYDLGVRWMLIAYNRANAAGDGCLDEEDHGLTPFGRQVIDAMNTVGMVLCCTHAGYRTAREAIDHSSDPVIFSHSNARAVYDHPRNIPDDLARACAARGGVIGLNGIGIFLGPNDASISTFIRHVEHFLDVVGEDHVGIGTDYIFDKESIQAELEAHPEAFPEHLFPRGKEFEMLAPWDLASIAAAMAARGHSAQTLAKLFGGNLERVANQVWR